jgi:aminoglycoside/choline kinase family phosphotransferase
VPKLCAADGPRGAVLLEDLGDRTMLHELGERDGEGTEMELFRQALRLLGDFHTKTQMAPGWEPVPGYRLAFDEEKLMWEVDFTLEHLFGSYLKRRIPEREQEAIRTAFSWTSAAGWPPSPGFSRTGISTAATS